MTEQLARKKFSGRAVIPAQRDAAVTLSAERDLGVTLGEETNAVAGP